MIQKPFRGIQLNRSHPLAKGLVGCWLFNEATGETVFDSSCNGNNGTLENGVIWGSGGLDFDGVNDYVDCGNDSSLRKTNNMSVFCWTKGNPQSNKAVIARYDTGVEKRVWYVFSGASDTSKLGVILSDDGTFNAGHYKYYESIITVFDNNWHYAGFTFASGTLKLYVDGVEDANPNKINNDAFTSVFNTDIKMVVGCRLNDGSLSYPFNGSTRSVSIYNQVKSAEEIAWSYREPYAMFGPVFNPALLYSAAPPVGAIMNQFQKANIGADLYNGVFA